MISRLVPVAIALLFASAAAAQTLQEPVSPNSLGFGALWSFPPGGAGLSGTPGVKVSWQRWYGPRLGTEVHAGWWHGETRRNLSAPASVSIEGVRVPEYHEISRNAQTESGVAFAILGRMPLGRATIVLGGGPGWFLDRQDSDSRVSFGGVEQHHKGAQTFSSLGIQVVAEIEVRATRGLSAFGGFISQVRDARYRESNIAYPNGGLRFAF